MLKNLCTGQAVLIVLVYLSLIFWTESVGSSKVLTTEVAFRLPAKEITRRNEQTTHSLRRADATPRRS